MIKQIRVSETQPNVTRVVLDLVRVIDFSAAQLANPDRLVVELSPGVDRRRRPRPAPAAPGGGSQAAVTIPAVTPAAPSPDGGKYPSTAPENGFPYLPRRAR